MTMTPEKFRDLLDEATSAAPPAPPGSDALSVGGSRLRRRRLAAVAGTVVALTVGGVVATLPGRGPDRAADRVGEDLSDSQLLNRCLDAPSDPRELALTASGPAHVATSVRTDLKITSVLASADGTLWATCWIWLQPQATGESGSGIDLFDATHRTHGLAGGWMVGTGCGVPETQESGCDRWSVDGAGKLPPEVAAVRLDLGDGTSVTVPTVDGYFVVNVLHPVPPGGTVRHDGTIAGFEWGRQLTYLAADGSPLAAARLDSPRDPDVPGIPSLSSVPSLGVPWQSGQRAGASESVQP